MRYQYIQAKKAHYPVQVLCRVLGVARSGYYAWCDHPLSLRRQQNEQLVACIRRSHLTSRGRCGRPRIHQDLRAQGLRVGRHRVARLMRLHGIRSVGRLRRRSPAPPAVVTVNTLQRDFTATRPNHKWVGDLT
jgi:putative transposase